MVRIAVLYPADPLGSIPGGIETFIRGILRHAPMDLSFDVIGVTTNPATRPVGKWTDCQLDGRSFRLFPIAAVRRPGQRSLVPETVRYLFSLIRHLRSFKGQYDVFDYHRLEPALFMRNEDVGRNIFFHQNMSVIRSPGSDIRWRYLPWVYEFLERRTMYQFSSVYAVRSDAVEAYRERFPELAEHIRFTPTWVDTQYFFPVSRDKKLALRRELLAEHPVNEETLLFVTVGRLDTQKDPLLLLQAFAQVKDKRPSARLLIVGDGVLRSEVEKQITKLGLRDSVVLAGLVEARKVADYVRCADIFVLSSAYEGMPMALLEGVACGLPAASTDVGEVRRAVRNGENGYVSDARTPQGLAGAMEACLEGRDGMPPERCLASVQEFVPEAVLSPIYDNYRRIGGAKCVGAEGKR